MDHEGAATTGPPHEVPDADRVREHTSSTVLSRLDRELRVRLEEYAGRSEEEITKRIAEVEAESDLERVLEANAAVLALAGLGAGVFLNRKWLALTGAVMAFLLQHAVQGWCPPVPLFRRLGIRTRQEIDAERFALKALRGDFAGVDDTHAHARGRRVQGAVSQ